MDATKFYTAPLVRLSWATDITKTFGRPVAFQLQCYPDFTSYFKSFHLCFKSSFTSSNANIRSLSKSCDQLLDTIEDVKQIVDAIGLTEINIQESIALCFSMSGYSDFFYTLPQGRE